MQSGGTSFCELARINGCATQSFSQKRNCLIKEFDDAPRWVSKDVHAKRSPPNNMRSQWYANYGTRPRNPVSCPHRKRFMLKRHFNIYANEFTLLGGTRSPQSLHLCHHSVNVLQLRHPHHRLQSHLRWIWLMYRLSYGNNITSFFPSMKDGGQSVARDWEELAPAPTHNYYTRSLLGEATYRLPPENLTERHLHLARLVISQFDVLLLLEEPAMNDLLFQFALGWKFTLSSVKARSADGVESEALVGFALPSDFKAMLARNAIDLELYKFGFMLSLMDAVVFDIAKVGAGLGLPVICRARYTCGLHTVCCSTECMFICLLCAYVHSLPAECMFSLHQWGR